MCQGCQSQIEKMPNVRSLQQLEKLVFLWSSCMHVGRVHQKEGEGWGPLEDLPSSYLRYCLGFLLFRLREGSFNRLPIGII
jgi:hypothetical protein